MIAQILWWIPMLAGAAIGVVITAVFWASKMDRMRSRHREVEAIYVEIINKQIAEISSLKFYEAFRRNMGKKDIEPGGPKL